jgi:hypothetical protein
MSAESQVGLGGQMRTGLLTFFTIALLSTALAASALGAITSPDGGAAVDAILGNGATERQPHGTDHAVTPVVLLPQTSGQAPAAATVRLPSTSTAPSSSLLGVLVAGAGAASGLTLLVMAGRRRR